MVFPDNWITWFLKIITALFTLYTEAIPLVPNGLNSSLGQLSDFERSLLLYSHFTLKPFSWYPTAWTAV